MSQDTQDQGLSFNGHTIAFDAGMAELCGVNAAIVLNHIIYWIKFNRDNTSAQKENKIWMYESQEKMCEYLTFLSPKQVKLAIQSLVENEIIEKKNFNKNHFDNTNWYTLTDRYFKKVFTIVPKRPVDETFRAGQKSPTGPVYIKDKEKEKKQDIKIAAMREREDLPDKSLQSAAAAACEKISSFITLKNTKGQEVSITISEIYLHFQKFNYSTYLIDKMICILKQEKNPVSNILKLAEKICERLSSEEHGLSEEKQRYADKIKDNVVVSNAPSGKINILEELKKHEREKNKKSHR